VVLPAIAVAALGLGALVPWPGRDVCVAALLFLLLMSPIVAIGVGIASWERARFGTWFGLVPLTIVWLGWFELRYGVSARIAPRDGRRRPE
jgi:hypothetical protein